MTAVTTSFKFFIEVPGFPADYALVDLAGLYAGDEIVDIKQEKALSEWVESLPCCTTNADGTRNGDPLNFVLVATD